MSNLSIATCPNLGADKLLQSFFPATAVQQAVLSTLSNPKYDSLCSYLPRPGSCLPRPDLAELAEEVFFTISLLTEDGFKAMDCGTLNHLYRKAMQFIHPDQNLAQDRGRAVVASINLNNAQGILRCR